MTQRAPLLGATGAWARRSLAAALALALALVAALALASPASAATQTFPANGTFDAGQGDWTEGEVCAGSLLPGLVCSPLLVNSENFVTGPGGVGNPAPAVGFRSSFLVGLLQLATPVSVWSSPEFTYEGGEPDTVSFRYDRRADIADLLALPDSRAAAQVVLVRTDGPGGETVIHEDDDLGATAGFETVNEAVAPSALVDGATYRIDLRTQFKVGGLVALLTSAAVYYDNVALTVETDVPAPDATTLPAVDVAPGELELFGEVNPNGDPTTYQFEFGSTPALGDTVPVPPADVGDGTDPVSVSETITGTPGETVFYRVSATNSEGATSRGQILSARFPEEADVPAPDADTLPAIAVSEGVLEFRGDVNPNGVSTEYEFRYGSSATSLTESTGFVSAGDGTSTERVRELVSGAPGETVFFRVVAQSAGGEDRGAVREAEFPEGDPADGPSAVTVSALGAGEGALDLRGSVNPNGDPTEYRFQYGPTAALGQSTPVEDAGDGTDTQTVTERIEGTPGEEVFFRVVAVDSQGRSATGDILTATFPEATDPGNGNGNGNGGGGQDDPGGAGGLGACTADLSVPQLQRGPGGDPSEVALSAQQLLINQRISQAGVRRVNTVIDTFTAGLTANAFRDCSIGAADFHPGFVGQVEGGAAADPPGQVQGPRPTPTRPSGGGDPSAVNLSRQQLLINQRISQAAVRRVNAVRERLDGNITAGDLREGAITALKLDTSGRATFDRALPAGPTVDQQFEELETVRQREPTPDRVRLTREQLLINQRISQAAVRRINQVRAEFTAGLTGAYIRDGSLGRANLSPSIQAGER